MVDYKAIRLQCDLIVSNYMKLLVKMFARTARSRSSMITTSHLQRLVSSLHPTGKKTPTQATAPKTQCQLRPFLSPQNIPVLVPFRPFSVSSTQYDSNSGSITIVRVPPMAESISEGTLSRFNKAVGDFIEADEEIASIETDKIDVSVNAPEAGVVTRLLVAEGDVVAVDQEIAEIGFGQRDADGYGKRDVMERHSVSELSEVSENGSSKGKLEDTTVSPAPQQSSFLTAQNEKTQPSLSAQPTPLSGAPAEQSEGIGDGGPSRAEEVVSSTLHNNPSIQLINIYVGENDTNAPNNRETPKRVAKHRCFLNNVQRSRHVATHQLPEEEQRCCSGEARSQAGLHGAYDEGISTGAKGDSCS